METGYKIALASMGVIQGLTLFILAGLREDIRDLRTFLMTCPNCKRG